MKRFDQYRGDFDPDAGNGSHIVHLMDGDIHEVQLLSGNHTKVRVIVDALRALRGITQTGRAAGYPTRYSLETIDTLLGDIELPQFAPNPADTPAAT